MSDATLLAALAHLAQRGDDPRLTAPADATAARRTDPNTDAAAAAIRARARSGSVGALDPRDARLRAMAQDEAEKTRGLGTVLLNPLFGPAHLAAQAHPAMALAQALAALAHTGVDAAHGELSEHPIRDTAGLALAMVPTIGASRELLEGGGEAAGAMESAAGAAEGAGEAGRGARGALIDRLAAAEPVAHATHYLGDVAADAAEDAPRAEQLGALNASLGPLLRRLAEQGGRSVGHAASRSVVLRDAARAERAGATSRARR